MINIVEFKPATEAGDLEIVRKIALTTWPHTFAEILSKDQIDYMLELLYSIPSLETQVGTKGHKFILCCENNEPVGFSSYELNCHDIPKTKIHKIYILPATQSKGYGKMMMYKIKQIALENSQVSLVLNVNKYNRAIQFYEYLGFNIIGEEVIDIGSGYVMDDYVMEHPLNING